MVEIHTTDRQTDHLISTYRANSRMLLSHTHSLFVITAYACQFSSLSPWVCAWVFVDGCLILHSFQRKVRDYIKVYKWAKFSLWLFDFLSSQNPLVMTMITSELMMLKLPAMLILLVIRSVCLYHFQRVQKTYVSISHHVGVSISYLISFAKWYLRILILNTVVQIKWCVEIISYWLNRYFTW